ncbi:hypothetical protein NKF26_12090 [Haladaptatus sp. AB618]|uniref:hypothetical protein n=1 Tax=Haladaptatus sp. AB618 TaxID=2934173 RepID=UPI00209BCA89|nr:hypothetical protein [Haladaptatus sp. AB618]MCO8254543.1 hypothetical protein [Haladaptatus sp. AB618]
MGRWIKKLNNIAAVDGGTLENVVPKALLLPVIALFYSIADVIGAFADVPIAIFQGFSESAKLLISGFLQSPGKILTAGAQQSAYTLQNGVWAQFGPLTYVLAVAVVVGSALIVARYTAEEETGNLIPGIPFDVPIIGNDEDD